MFNIVLFVVYILLFVELFKIGIFARFEFMFILIDDEFASFIIEFILIVESYFVFNAIIHLLVASYFVFNVPIHLLDDVTIRFHGLRLIG